jgi:hypothetical protein
LLKIVDRKIKNSNDFFEILNKTRGLSKIESLGFKVRDIEYKSVKKSKNLYP